MQKNKAFTLIELMFIVVVISILCAIAIPSYHQYIIRAEAAKAQQEILMLSEQLERYKSRNFSYRGFNPQYLYNTSSAISTFKFPSENKHDYTISLVDISVIPYKTLLSSDTGLGKKWAIKVIPSQANRYALLLTSTGIRCKTKYMVANDLNNINAYTGCGENSEAW